MRIAAVGVMIGAAPAWASVVVYDTFGAGGSFDTSQGYVVSGDDVPYALNQGQTHGVRFRSSVSGRLDRIDAALQLVSGTNTVWMELWTSDGPWSLGSMVGSWEIDDEMDVFGGPGAVSVELGGAGPELDEGERYWLVPRAMNDTDAGWMYGEAGAGPFVWEQPSGVQTFSTSFLPAARVTVVPAPGTGGLVAACVAVSARRRRCGS